jgi:hypothetical protein
MLFLRKIRGAVGIALLWSVAWAITGMLTGLYRAIAAPDGLVRFYLRTLPIYSINWALFGFVFGMAFSLAFALIERRSSLATLSLVRVAAWGALAPNALLFLFTFVDTGDLPNVGDAVVVFLILGSLGAASAAATLGVARHGLTSEQSRETAA